MKTQTTKDTDILNAVILKTMPNIEDYDDIEEYYDGYWQIVLENQLIFLPNNHIIFWGFETSISKKQCDLLKSIIELNTKSYSEDGYSEEQIIKNVGYTQENLEKNRLEAYKRFIITSSSIIKRKIKSSIKEACINRISVNRYNPFIKGVEKDKLVEKDDIEQLCSTLRNDSDFMNKILKADLNLVKIFTYLLNFTDSYDKTYSSFHADKALDKLISSVEGQKQKTKHRFFKTEFTFRQRKLERRKKIDRKIRAKDNNFMYAKITPTKANTNNFIN